jgi:hypothetical protein
VRVESSIDFKTLNSPLDQVRTAPKYQDKGVINDVGLRLVDRYINNEIYLLVVFKIRGETGDFAALLERAKVYPTCGTGQHGRLEAHGDQAPVLVDVVELVQRSPRYGFRDLSNCLTRPEEVISSSRIPHTCPSCRAISSLVVGTFLAIGKAVLDVGSRPLAITSLAAR